MPASVDLQQLAIDRDQPDRARVATRRHLLTRYVLPSLLVVGFLSLLLWSLRDVLMPAQPVTVMTVISATAEIRQEGAVLFNAAGWVEPRPTPIRVAALAAGVVEHLLVVEDQAVEKGEPVAQLVIDDARLQHAKALANLKLREAERDEAKSYQKAARVRFDTPVHLEAALREAEATLAKLETQWRNLPFESRRAEADMEALRKDYEGKQAARGVVAAVDIDIARSKLKAAEALVEELRDREDSLTKERAALEGRRSALETQLELLADETRDKEQSESKLRAADARVEQARVAAEEAKLQLDRMTVRAPVDGRVFRLIAHPGTRVGGGMASSMDSHDGGTIVTMYRPDRLQVRVDVRFEDLPKVRLGQPVRINNPALEEPVIGRVLFVSSEADIQKNTLEVKIEIPDPPAVFKPEMLVDVTFLAPKPTTDQESATHEQTLYVPQQLIDRDEQGNYVWVADQSDRVARKVRVKTGSPGGNGLVEVIRGLNVTSRLIVSGRDVVEDGQAIELRGDDSTLLTNGANTQDSTSSE